MSAGTYTLSESGPAGYDASAWSCTGGQQSGNQITLSLDESATCTIINDDQPAHLTLVKEIVNDNGGTAAATDWRLTATGPSTFSGATGGDLVTDVAVSAGPYALSESGPGGYTAGSWSCTGGTMNGSSVTLGLGQSATCTITNDDDKASPSGTTVQSWILHDSLTITGMRTGEGAGVATAAFSLYSNAECTSQVGQTDTVPVTGDVLATATGVAVSAPGTYYWQVTYSGNTFNNGFTTACGHEVTTIVAKDALHTAP